MNEEDRSKLREDLEALLASAENWLGIWEEREKGRVKGCACCKLSARRSKRAGWEGDDCDFCPIKEETQLSSCIGTPYEEFITWKLGTPQSKKAAEREYEFLIGIGLKKMRLLMEDAERGSHQKVLPWVMDVEHVAVYDAELRKRLTAYSKIGRKE